MDEKNQPLDREQIPAFVAAETAADRLIIDDWHTHLLGPKAGPELSLHGIDQQLTYHYVRRKLVAAGRRAAGCAREAKTTRGPGTGGIGGQAWVNSG